MATSNREVGPVALVQDSPRDADAWAAAPLEPQTARELRALVARLAPAQRLWLSGYLAGTVDRPAAPAVQSSPAITILYGSHTGNSEALARRLAERLSGRRIPHKLLDMLECRKADLEQARTLLIVVSTHGDGDPPERALPVHELLHGRKAPRLEHVRYSVLALGDSSYENFCATGRQFDERLAALGAARLHPRTECDVDFEAAASAWIEAVATQIDGDAGEAAVVPTAGHGSGDARPSVVANAYTRKNPFHALVLANQRLTARGSTKDVRHVELSLEESNIHYEPGDALGVVARNRESDVDALLRATGFPADAAVGDSPGDAPDARAEPASLRDVLLSRREIGTVSAAFARRYAAAAGHEELANRAADAGYLYGRDVLDVVTEFPPHGIDAAEFARLLPPLAPRLYSIASSAAAAPGEAHLTIGVVEYEARGRARRGVVSGEFPDLEEGAELPVYLHRNSAFRLPSDPRTDVVMIAAGTGIAPFRAFLAERESAGAAGRNWLFFGDRSFELDFLYQAEWLNWRKRGILQRLDLAFSRDQAHKVYVQDRLLERGAELWEWLAGGAHLYLCGDATRMAPDVERALLEIARRHGGLTDDGAREALLDLQRARRYQKDVY